MRRFSNYKGLTIVTILVLTMLFSDLEGQWEMKNPSRPLLDSLVSSYLNSIQGHEILTSRIPGSPNHAVWIRILEARSDYLNVEIDLTWDIALFLSSIHSVIAAFFVDSVGCVVTCEQLKGFVTYPSIELHTVLSRVWPYYYPMPDAPPPFKYEGNEKEWYKNHGFLARMGASVWWELEIIKGEVRKKIVFDEYERLGGRRGPRPVEVVRYGRSHR